MKQSLPHGIHADSVGRTSGALDTLSDGAARKLPDRTSGSVRDQQDLRDLRLPFAAEDPTQSRLGDACLVGHRALREPSAGARSEEHTSELQSRGHLVCRLLLEKKNIARLADETR